ncbi:unnamed protein product, partial [Staurois parvus]
PGPQICQGPPVPPPPCCGQVTVFSPVPTFRSPHTAWVPFCHKVLADYGPSHCCCQALICSWAPVTALLMLLAGPQCSWVPEPPPHCCCLHRHTLPCATFRSPHTAGVLNF